ncbi:MAG: hypothetical protein NVSMB27_19260 [Ktedonobacteraceae bacterium]
MFPLLVALDISCEHCQHAIEGAVGKLAGVSTVKVDIPTKSVHIDYAPQKVTLVKIEEVLDDNEFGQHVYGSKCINWLLP